MQQRNTAPHYVFLDVNKTIMAADEAGGKSLFQGIVAAG